MVREATKKDLDEILQLYLYLHEESVSEDTGHLRRTWENIINDLNHHLIVCEVDNRIVASCVCVIIPNLTRNVRPYAFVENVVTHGDYRKKGYATSGLNYAQQIAKDNNCYLRAASKLSNDVDMSVVEKQSYAYYMSALETGEHIAYLVYDNGAFIGAGGVSFYQVMPTYHNPTGKKAYIMNMYTAPDYRRQGIAIYTLDLLVNDARKQGVSQIALEATDMGRPLYEKYGFVKMEDEMELKHRYACSDQKVGI